MDLQEQLIRLRKETGMKRTDFARYFDIPYRTLQDWELGNRKIPEYLLRLMEYKVRMEALLEEKNIDPEQMDKYGRDGEFDEES